MLYLSPIWKSLLPQYRHRFGYILGIRKGDDPQDCLPHGYPWLLDNGAFSDKWDERRWRGALDRLRPYRSACIGAVVPDVVADAGATQARFEQYAPVVRGAGYPVAFVTQDGLALDAVPWAEIDVLFIGGSDEHKLTAMPFVLEGKRRGKWVHVGRVNSVKRMNLFWVADSCDGTSLAINPEARRQRMYIHAMEAIRGKKLTCSLF